MALPEDHDPSLSSVPCQCASGSLMKFHEIINYKCPWAWNSANPLLTKMHWPGKLVTNWKQIHVQYNTLIPSGKKPLNILTVPPPPQEQERRPLLADALKWLVSGDPAQRCIGLRHKIQITYFMLAILLRQFPPCQLRLWSCAGASTTHLGCSHHAKDGQASDTTHFHRCLAAEILSSILNVRSVMSSAKSKHSDNPTMSRTEKLLWGLHPPDRHFLLQGCYCWSCTGKVPQVFWKAVFVLWSIWAHISTARGSCVRVTTLGQPPASRVAKLRSCR